MTDCSFRVRTLLIASAVSLGLGGCGTIKKINQTLDTINRFGKNLNETLEAAKNAASESGSAEISTLAKVPKLPAAATGGKDLTAAKMGMTGTTTEDLDDDGNPEDLTVFVDDTDETYVVWEGDAGSEDAGYCYLAWEEGIDIWVVFADCAAADEAFVCQYDVETDDIACAACNQAGQCTTCDLDDPDDDCDPDGAGEEGGEEDGGDSACLADLDAIDATFAECGFAPLPETVCDEVPGAVAQCADDIDTSEDPCFEIEDQAICAL